MGHFKSHPAYLAPGAPIISRALSDTASPQPHTIAECLPNLPELGQALSDLAAQYRLDDEMPGWARTRFGISTIGPSPLSDSTGEVNVKATNYGLSGAALGRNKI